MRVAVWRTGHEIADTVAEAVSDGLEISKARIFDGNYGELESFDAHIAYGILRGTDKIFRWCEANGKPWFNIDKGYFKPGHYDGYYRVSLRGTQQTFGLDKLEPDYERWDRLGIEVLPHKKVYGRPTVCPPTDHVERFFNKKWSGESLPFGGLGLWRYKGCDRPLDEDLSSCTELITFNSSVGWEALRQGIPVVSDPNHSIVGAYQKLVAKEINMDYDARRKLFGIMSSLQLTLDEIRAGKLWPLMSRLLSTSVTTDAKL